MLGTAGCTGSPGMAEIQTEPAESTDSPEIPADHITEDLEAYSKAIYEQALEDVTLGSPETVGKTVLRLGQEGLAAVDQDNQFDLEHPELVEQFCGKVEEHQQADLQLIVVLNNGGFVEFELRTEDGQVDVCAKSFAWREKRLVHTDTDNYRAHRWLYTDSGYLFFQKYYMEGFSGPYSHVAVRVKPLDPLCRELNRKYILPVGYHMNNLFTANWDETDYSDLDFYDLFEILQRIKDPESIPYSAGSDSEIIGIPQSEFEDVILTWFSIDRHALRKTTGYSSGSGTYQYRPRGLYDSNSGTEIPFPEVIDCETREDGTMELTVSAVWPEMNLGSAFLHKVVIRPFEDGSFHYLSNRVVSLETNAEPSWYTKRLTEETRQTDLQIK